jgi:hypothetical protein
MTDTDTAAFLDRLEALHAQATPGTWSQHPSDGEYVIAGATDNDGEFDYAVDVCDTYAFRKANPIADAAAIVAEHNALPLLVAAVRAAYALAEADEARAKVCRDASKRATASLGEQDYYERMAEVGEQSAARLRAALDEALGGAK